MVVFGAGLPDVDRYHTCGNDTSAAAGLVVNHLVDLGHQDIAFVNFAKPEYLAVNERERGWREAMQQRGVEIDSRWVVHADITVDSGYAATRALLARKVEFTALFAGNDTIAFGAMRALREAGYSIPRDVAVVGYDDIPMAAYASPPLTTIRTDTAGLGRDAMHLLMTLLQRTAGTERLSREKPVELIIRESCGASLKFRP
jgi:LacI family transcriptional regulator